MIKLCKPSHASNISQAALNFYSSLCWCTDLCTLLTKTQIMVPEYFTIDFVANLHFSKKWVYSILVQELGYALNSKPIVKTNSGN
jgi:hypothetical protein